MDELEVGQGEVVRLDGLLSTLSEADDIRRVLPVRHFVPSDTYFPSQTWFNRIGDARKIWDEFNGSGVSTLIVDDGVEFTHPDLSPNYDASKHLVYNGTTYSGAPKLADDGHGTSVAGLIAANVTGSNGVGLGWASKITGVNIFDSASPLSTTVSGFVAAVAHSRNFDVTNNSWGYSQAYIRDLSPTVAASEGARTREAWITAAETGRSGLGTVVVKSAGNEDHDANSESSTSYAVIHVAASDVNGFTADFSSYGANVLVTAPGVAVQTTDRVGSNGYSSGSTTPDFGGTSSAGPIVAGVVTLMLDANPTLGWRDVQDILAYSATHTGTAIGSTTKAAVEDHFWFRNGANTSNLQGLHFSEDYGFGQVNVYNAVRMAEVWSLVRSARTSANDVQIVRDVAVNQNFGTTFNQSFNFTAPSNVEVDYVEVTLTLSANFFSQLNIFLVSPSGTEAQLAMTGYYSVAAAGSGAMGWIFGAQAFRGESTGAGNWTLRIADSTASGTTGSVNTFSVRWIGDTASADDHYVFTNEYTARTLNDLDGGRDAMNFAAVTGAAVVDLTRASNSSVNGLALTLQNQNTRTLIGGDGADRFTGDATDNVLYGMRGVDVLNGGAGADYLAGGAANDVLTGGAGSDTAAWASPFAQMSVAFRGASLVFNGAEGVDVVSGVEAFQFSDRTISRDAADGVDDLWYLATYRDVAGAGIDADDHFNGGGRAEGRNPNAHFDRTYYLQANPDVAAAGIDPWLHFIGGGWTEGRNPSAAFNLRDYLLANPDVRASGENPLLHYLRIGMDEGRSRYAIFDDAFYLAQNPDIDAARVDPYLHWVSGGRGEGRDPHPLFDADGYLATYAAARASGLDALTHYLTQGWQLGYDPSTRFDTGDYLAANPDVAAAGINPLLHYLAGGRLEGRLAYDDGVWG